MSDHCDCGNEHHDHHHEHHDHTNAHNAEKFVVSALRKSATRAVFFDAPVSAKVIAAQKMATLSEIAERVAFEGIILGHIKALLDFGVKKVSISITRLDECRRSFDDLGDFEVTSYVLTVNVLSLQNTDVELEDLIESLFGK